VAGDVFISYAHDDKLTADAACAVLERNGIRCWIAPRDIFYGQDYGAAIMDAITAARIMVLILSQHANASEQVKREVEGAVRTAKIIVPVRIEDVRPSRALEYFISTSHWLDAFPPPHQDYFEQLADSISRLLGGKPADAKAAPPSAPVMPIAPTPPPQPAPPTPPLQPTPPPRQSGAIDERTLEFEYWSDIKNSVDPTDFETFLEKFPQGTYEPRARQRVETLLPKAPIEQVRRFLHEHPASSRAGLANNRLVELEWVDVERSRDASRMRAFIAEYARSPYCAPAKLALAKLEWARLYSGGDAGEIERTFANLGDASEAVLAARRVTWLRDEEAAWASATAANNAASLGAYLRAFPGGRHAADARTRLKARDSHDGPRELTYAMIAAAGVVGGIIAAILMKLDLVALSLGDAVSLVNADRVLYVGAIIVLLAMLTQTRSPQKLAVAVAVLYAIETIFDTIHVSGLGFPVKDGIGMLIEWLVTGALFLTAKDVLNDRAMMAIAVAVGAAQGLLLLLLLIGGIDSTLIAFLASPFSFATTGLCLAYGVRRQRQAIPAVT
jgi:hypothetical protein